MPEALISIFKIEFWVVTAICTAAPVPVTQGKHKDTGEGATDCSANEGGSGSGLGSSMKRRFRDSVKAF